MEVDMTKVNFRIKDKKYQMVLDSKDNNVKIIALESKAKDFIFPKETKVFNFINYMLSLELKWGSYE